MNRVDNWIGLLQVQAAFKKGLEREYEGKTKATIYNYRRDQYIREVKKLTQKLTEFGNGEIHTWDVAFYDSKDIHHKVQLNLVSDITEDEIRSYYENLKGCSVISISPRHHIKLGFQFS